MAIERAAGTTKRTRALNTTAATAARTTSPGFFYAASLVLNGRNSSRAMKMAARRHAVEDGREPLHALASALRL